MVKKRSKRGLPPFLPSIMYPKKREKKTAPEIPPGKKPREYDLLYLDDLEKLLFTPIEALSFIAEELRGRALAEIAGKRELKEELFDLKILYESGGLSKDEYEKRVKELMVQI